MYVTRTNNNEGLSHHHWFKVIWRQISSEPNVGLTLDAAVHAACRERRGTLGAWESQKLAQMRHETLT